MMAERQRRALLVFLVILIFALHVLYVLLVQLPQRQVRLTGKKTDSGGLYQLALFDDEIDYVNLAYHLSRQGVFSLDGDKPTALRVPLFPLMLTPVFILTADATWALGLNCLLVALTALGCYFLGKLYYSPRAGLMAMLIVGASPHTFNWLLWLQAEALLSCLLVFFLVSFTCLMRYQKSAYAGLSGVLAGLAGLARPEAVLLVPLYLGYLVYQGRFHRPVTLRLALVFTFAALGALTPWVARNYVTLHYPGLSTLGGFTFAGGHNEKTLAAHRGSWYAFSAYASAAEINHTQHLDEVAFDRYLWQRGWRLLRRLTLAQFLYLELNKLHKTFKPSFRLWGKEYGRETLNLLLVTPYVLLYLVFGGLLLTLPFPRLRPRLPGSGLLLLALVVPLTVTLIFWGSIRFRTPYEPLAFTLCVPATLINGGGKIIIKWLGAQDPAIPR